jgi:hypothetical protein
MATGATISSIKTGLATAYAAITLPVLGAPLAANIFKREMDSVPSVYPSVEIYTNPSQAIRKPRDEGSYEVTRLFVVRLYTALLPDDTPSIEEPDYIKAENCIEPIEDYFQLTDDRLNTAFVLDHTVTVDTAGVMLYTRANRYCVGVAFQHQITYYRMR